MTRARVLSFEKNIEYDTNLFKKTEGLSFHIQPLPDTMHLITIRQVYASVRICLVRGYRTVSNFNFRPEYKLRTTTSRFSVGLNVHEIHDRYDTHRRF